MAEQVLIPWAHAKALGARAEGDPPEKFPCGIGFLDGQFDEGLGCRTCPHGKPDADFDFMASCPRDLDAPLVLPDSGAFVLRVLWRRLGGRGLGCMEVPRLLRGPTGTWWVYAYPEGKGYRLLPFSPITDPCKALAAIVAAEVEKKADAD